MAAFAWFSRPDARSLAVGLPVSALGLLLRGWATGHVEKNIRLAESGPYAYVRNPLYLGTLLVAAGFAIASRRWPLAVLFGIVFVFIYLPAIELEEQHLRTLFPQFAGYAQRVPALWPTLNPPATTPAFSVGALCSQSRIPSRNRFFGWGAVLDCPGVHTSVNAARRSACATFLVSWLYVWHRRLYREQKSSPYHSGWPAPAGIPRV